MRDAVGAILAHSVLVGKRRIRKGSALTASDISDLKSEGISQVTVAVIEKDDVHEDEAAHRLAAAFVSGHDNQHFRLSPAFTGRVNIYAKKSGLFRVAAEAITQVNRIDPSITVATLADYSRVHPRTLLATIKIIPFATSVGNLSRACAAAGGALGFAGFGLAKATLILTNTPLMSEKLLAKGHQTIAQRMRGLEVELEVPSIVPHEISDLATAIRAANSDLILILAASATSDENDVGPAALVAAGGQLIRFGMPVDPGNLLFLGKLGTKTVVGLPGCARSPALNGADWVLERVAAGIDVSSDDIAAMGVGGLLKEIPSRPQSRGGATQLPARPIIQVILLAAGSSTRMRGTDKLLEDVDGIPLLRRAAKTALASQADHVIVLVPPEHDKRRAALEGLSVQVAVSPGWQEGMAASIRAGLNALSQKCDGVIVALADMPDVTVDHLNLLIAAFDPSENREICRAVTQDGSAGHPVLFGRRFFESLAALSGDKGARDIIRDATDFLVDVPTPGNGALTDLDTPEDWEKWRQR
ncbi:MAG: NTP transferase domain-containing protein [Paracoccaceae bacterium]